MESPAGSVSDPKALILKEVNFIAFLIFNLNLTVCTVSGLAEQLSAGTTLEHEEDMGHGNAGGFQGKQNVRTFVSKAAHLGTTFS